MTSCQEGEFPNLRCQVKSISGSVEDVTGTWQLVQIKEFNMQTGKVNQRDYSCKNIFYDFRNDGIVQVENNGEQTPLFEDGEFEFEFSLSPFHETMEGYTLKIRNSSWPLFLQSDEMILDASPLDGETIRFIRVL